MPLSYPLVNADRVRYNFEPRYPDMADFSREIMRFPAIGRRQIVSEVSATGCSCVRQNAGFRQSAFWRTQLRRTLPCQDIWTLKSTNSHD